MKLLKLVGFIVLFILLSGCLDDVVLVSLGLFIIKDIKVVL